MTNQVQTTDRWQLLSDGAGWVECEITEHPAKRSTSSGLHAARIYLEGILEVFPEPEDPLKDFEGHAVHKMADWLYKAIGHLDSGRNGGALALRAVTPLNPRLLDLHGAAAYLGVSERTVRSLEHAGILPRVRVPLVNHTELHERLFDRADLGRLIETWKESGARTNESR